MSYNWKNILVLSSESIKNALKVIDQESLRVALVVDKDHKLLGTVTDGDIRRALIQGKLLDAPVSDVMCSEPTTANINSTRNQLISIMEEKDLLAIPIIENGKVIGLETLNLIYHRKKYDNPVFIMAGGFGKRLRPLTDNCPKPMLKVGKKPILETVITNFISAGFHKFYISTHYMPEIIKDYFGDGEKWNVSIEYLYEDEPLGTGGALGLLPKSLPELPVIIMNGDILTNIDLEKLLQNHVTNNAQATMCVREFEYQIPFGVVDSEGGRIKSMVEKPTQRFHINAGIYVIGKEIIDSIVINKKIDMPSLLDLHLDKNIQVFPFYEYWLDIGRMDDFKKAQIDIVKLGLMDD